MTKVDAIKKVLAANGGVASWETIYNQIKVYYPEVDRSDEWQAGIRGVLYREIRNGRNFKKMGKGTFALID